MPYAVLGADSSISSSPPTTPTSSIGIGTVLLSSLATGAALFGVGYLLARARAGGACGVRLSLTRAKCERELTSIQKDIEKARQRIVGHGKSEIEDLE